MQNNVTIKGRVDSGTIFEVMPNSGKMKCKFDLAVPSVNQQFGIAQEVLIHVVTWNELAENTFNYVAKGNQLELTGRFDTRTYTNSQGQQREWTDFICFKVVRGELELGDMGFVRAESSMLPESPSSGDFTPAFEEGDTNGRPEPGITEAANSTAASVEPPTQG